LILANFLQLSFSAPLFVAAELVQFAVLKAQALIFIAVTLSVDSFEILGFLCLIAEAGILLLLEGMMTGVAQIAPLEVQLGQLVLEDFLAIIKTVLSILLGNSLAGGRLHRP
jgi:hypothetical protein